MISDVHHVGIAVTDLDEALALFRDTLGLPCVKEGDMPSRGVRVAMLAAGRSYLEIIQPVDDSSPFAKFIAERGQGLHHIALWSTDAAADVAKLRDLGVPLDDREPRDGFTGRLSYLHASAFDGAQLEVVEPEAALADVVNESDFRSLLSEGVTHTSSVDAASRSRRLDLAVAWLYEHRTAYDDPLAVLEEVWEAFDHAAKLNHMIRWMPLPPGEQAGADAIFERWRSYAERVRQHAANGHITRIDHVVLRVPSVTAVCEHFDSWFGVPTKRTMERGEQAFAFMRPGDVVIEVIGPKIGGDPGSGRIAGLAFEVQEIDALTETVRAKGYPIGEPHPALQGGRIVSVHHSGACGVPVAFIDFAGSPGPKKD